MKSKSIAAALDTLNFLVRKTATMLIVVFAIPVASTQAATPRPVDASKKSLGGVSPTAVSFPLSFCENRGQFDSRVAYRAATRGAAFWFTSDGAYYQFTRRIGEPVTSDNPGAPTAPAKGDQRDQNGEIRYDNFTMRAEFVGASLVAPRGVSEVENHSNYFIGDNPASWRVDVPNYQAVVYSGIYSGVDVKYYGNGSEMEYDFIVAPGADVSRIQVRYDGALGMKLDGAGQLVVTTPWGDIVDRAPVIYQLDGERRVTVVGSYQLRGDNSFGFNLGAAYNPALPTVIDPSLSYSTYLGGVGAGGADDGGEAIRVDVNGVAYVCGWTVSTDFPTVGQYQTNQTQTDAFVTKIAASGSTLVYSTYLGGTDIDAAAGIAVNSAGQAFICGYTTSTNFPTLTPIQTNQALNDCFVVKLSAAGNTLVYATYVGGDQDDYAYDIAIDASSNAFITGQTASTNFPTVGQFQTNQLLVDAFVTKINVAGTAYTYSTYLGGADSDRGNGIAIDGANVAYVVGSTNSANFPTLTPYQTDEFSTDGFVTKMNSAGNNVIWSTYLGGSSSFESLFDIVINASNQPLVVGYSSSADYPMASAIDNTNGAVDIVVTKFAANGASLLFSTFVGGSFSDWGYGIALDKVGTPCITGWTISTDYPTTPDRIQIDKGAADGVLTLFDAPLTSILYSTYLAGDSDDYAYAVSVDSAGSMFVAGNTRSTNFLNLGAYQSDKSGVDAFVTKVNMASFVCGDADGDASVTIGDAVYLISYIFLGGTPPAPLAAGDADGDSSITIGDAVYLISYIFLGGLPPQC